MRKTILYVAGIIVLFVMVAGCGQSFVRLGNRAVQQGDYYQAESYFQQALEKNPDDIVARRGLGRAYYHQKKYDEAVQQLELARRSAPEDGTTTLYLGLCREAQKDYAGAAGVYEMFLAGKAKGKIAQQIKGRLLFVRNEDMRRRVQEAIEFESQLATDTSAAMTIGVLPFASLGESIDSLRPLALGLAALVSSDLGRVHSLKLVERAELNIILEELARVEQGVTAAESAPRIGKLIGASNLVDGSVAFTGQDNIAVQSGIVNTDKALYNEALQSEDQLKNIWRLEKQITFAVLDSLGVSLTPEERNAIEKIPTENFEAFLAFSRGIEQLELGNYEAANEYFNQAGQLDPGFQQVEALQQEAGLLNEGSGSVEEFEAAVEEFLSSDIVDAGVETAEDIFEFSAPDIDPRTDDNPTLETGTATVRGTIR